LSSGQKQRVALAKALVLGPDLFVADEPTRGVDVLVRDSVLDVIGELRAEHGFAAIVVSSDLQVVERLTQRILVLSRGVIVGAGEIDDVLARPYHPYVRRMRESLGE